MLNIDLNISNVGFVISLLTAVLYAATSLWAYQTKIKKAATMDDIKESEARCMRSDEALEKKIDEAKSHTNESISHVYKALDDLKQGQRDMMQFLVSMMKDKNNHA